MLSRKTLIILAIIIIVVIGLAIALLLSDESFFGLKTPTDLTEQELGQPELTSQLTEEEEAEPPVILTPDEQYLMTVSRNFAERFASFSADSGPVNLEEVKLLASARLIKELDQMISEIQKPESYYGISSKVLKVDINELDEDIGSAQVTVTLQREETKQNQLPIVYYQDLGLSLISSGETWLVDSYKWQAQR